MLPIAHWPVRVQGIGENMPSNMLSFINFEPLELYWIYFLAFQTTIPKIPPMRLMSLDHEPKMRCYAMSSNYGLWWDYITTSFGSWASASFCEYELFWALKEIFPKSMIVLTWSGSPMKWSHMVWKFFPQHSSKSGALECLLEFYKILQEKESRSKKPPGCAQQKASDT